MSRKSDDNFLEHVADIQPLEQDKIISSRSQKSKGQSQSTATRKSQPENDHLFSDDYDPFLHDSERLNLNFHQSDYSTRRFKQLQTGHFEPDLILDLHGMTLKEARAAVTEFLVNCESELLTRITIIPGRGYDKLRQALNSWLRQYPGMLAYSESPRNDGGKGVIRCHIRRRD